MVAVVFVLFLLFVVVFIAGIIRMRRRTAQMTTLMSQIWMQASEWEVGRDLSVYREKHPQHAQNGRISCHACGGTSIFLHRSPGLGMVLNSHVCRTCGTELYRSRT